MGTFSSYIALQLDRRHSDNAYYNTAGTISASAAARSSSPSPSIATTTTAKTRSTDSTPVLANKEADAITTSSKSSSFLSPSSSSAPSNFIIDGLSSESSGSDGTLSSSSYIYSFGSSVISNSVSSYSKRSTASSSERNSGKKTVTTAETTELDNTHHTSKSPVSVITTLSIPSSNSSTIQSAASSLSSLSSSDSNSKNHSQRSIASSSKNGSAAELVTMLNTTVSSTETVTVTNDLSPSKITAFTTHYSTLLLSTTPTGAIPKQTSQTTTYAYVYTQPYMVTGDQTTFETFAPTTVTVVTYDGATLVSLSDYATKTVNADYYDHNIAHNGSGNNNRVPKLAGSITGSIGGLIVILILLWILFRKKNISLFSAKKEWAIKKSSEKRFGFGNGSGNIFKKNFNNKSFSENSDYHHNNNYTTNANRELTYEDVFGNSNATDDSNVNSMNTNNNNNKNNNNYNNTINNSIRNAEIGTAATAAETNTSTISKIFSRFKKSPNNDTNRFLRGQNPRPVPPRRTSADSSITTTSSVGTNSTTSTGDSDNGLFAIRDNLLQGIPKGSSLNFFKKANAAAAAAATHYRAGKGEGGRGAHTQYGRNRVIDTVYEESQESLNLSSRRSSLASTATGGGLNGKSSKTIMMNSKSGKKMISSTSSDNVNKIQEQQGPSHPPRPRPPPPPASRSKSGNGRVSKHTPVYSRSHIGGGRSIDRYSRAGLRNYYVNENPFETNAEDLLEDDDTSAIDNEFDEEFENDLGNSAGTKKHTPPPPPMPRKANNSHNGDIAESAPPSPQSPAETTNNFYNSGNNNNSNSSYKKFNRNSVYSNNSNSNLKRRSYESASSGEPFLSHNGTGDSDGFSINSRDNC